jgi:hypothetical protein
MGPSNRTSSPELPDGAAERERERDVVQFEGVLGVVKGGNAAAAPGLHHVEQQQQLG